MSERKVIQKYIPPDYDPSQVKRVRHKPPGHVSSGPRQQTVRLMAPFSMRCLTCGEHIAARKKFNARKETIEGEDYHGIKLFRFYIRCLVCASEITFRTDPKNTDFAMENGATRAFVIWRDPELDKRDEEKKKREEEEEMDPMKAVENQTEQSKKEMQILDELAELRDRNARMERVDDEAIVNKLRAKDAVSAQKELEESAEYRKRKAEEEEDDELARQIFRPAEQSKSENDPGLATAKTAKPGFAPLAKKKKSSSNGSPLGLIIKKKIEPSMT